jgi:DNA (cytosine-5)-methyltransferase 1
MDDLYTDHDPYCCEWLEALINDGQLPNGVVIERDIREIASADVAGYHHVHFFAGIGGWGAALKFAEWPGERPIWSGSCPCQSFSVAGKGRGMDDERHLWPVWSRLIRECRPSIIVGEQVESPAARAWLDLVFSDLENEGYTCWAADLCACGVGAPQLRQRLYWVALANNDRLQGTTGTRERETRIRGSFRRSGETDGLAYAEWIYCRDGKHRAVEPGSFPLAHGLPRGMGSLGPRCRELAEVAGLSQNNLREAKRNRKGRLMGYGNAIVVPLAVEFLRVVMEVIDD